VLSDVRLVVMKGHFFWGIKLCRPSNVIHLLEEHSTFIFIAEEYAKHEGGSMLKIKDTLSLPPPPPTKVYCHFPDIERFPDAVSLLGIICQYSEVFKTLLQSLSENTFRPFSKHNGRTR
jgi:hypothetical protein